MSRLQRLQLSTDGLLRWEEEQSLLKSIIGQVRSLVLPAVLPAGSVSRLYTSLSKIAGRRSDLYVQFVIDGKNYPVSFSKGVAQPGGRLSENAIANFVTALNDARSGSFPAEYPDMSKEESFSTLNVRDAVGAVVEACLNAPR